MKVVNLGSDRVIVSENHCIQSISGFLILTILGVLIGSGLARYYATGIPELSLVDSWGSFLSIELSNQPFLKIIEMLLGSGLISVGLYELVTGSFIERSVFDKTTNKVTLYRTTCFRKHISEVHMLDSIHSIEIDSFYYHSVKMSRVCLVLHERHKVALSSIYTPNSLDKERVIYTLNSFLKSI